MVLHLCSHVAHGVLPESIRSIGEYCRSNRPRRQAGASCFGQLGWHRILWTLTHSERLHHSHTRTLPCSRLLSPAVRALKLRACVSHVTARGSSHWITPMIHKPNRRRYLPLRLHTRSRVCVESASVRMFTKPAVPGNRAWAGSGDLVCEKHSLCNLNLNLLPTVGMTDCWE
jgi:hypothetical protein